MKIIFKIRFALLFLIGFGGMLLYSSCNNSSNNEGNQTNTTTTVNTDTVQETKTKQIFNLPSPIELYTFLYENNIKFQTDLLNSIKNIDKYITTTEKAINLGTYSSDVAYCTVYNKGNKTMDYFVAAKKLADELGLTEGFDEKTMERINKNLENSDSLYNISIDSYTMAQNYLRAQGQEDLLPLLVFGGWIESVYIAVNSYNETSFNANDPIVFQIIDQGYLLENLIDYYKSLSNKNEDIKKILTQLEDLHSIYVSMQDNVEVDITKEQFDNIKSKIQTIRNYWTKN